MKKQITDKNPDMVEGALNRFRSRVLARIPNLAVQICLLVSSRICVGMLGQKHVFWDLAAIFCFYEVAL